MPTGLAGFFVYGIALAEHTSCARPWTFLSKVSKFLLCLATVANCCSASMSISLHEAGELSTPARSRSLLLRAFRLLIESSLISSAVLTRRRSSSNRCKSWTSLKSTSNCSSGSLFPSKRELGLCGLYVSLLRCTEKFTAAVV